MSEVFLNRRLFTLNSLQSNSSYLQLVSTIQSFPHHQIMEPQRHTVHNSPCRFHSTIFWNILSPFSAHTPNRLHEPYSWIWLYRTALQSNASLQSQFHRPCGVYVNHTSIEAQPGLMLSGLRKSDEPVMMSYPAQFVWLGGFFGLC